MATNNSNEQIRNISIQDRQAQNTAADWARQLRFSSDVNKSTVGVDTDRVTPDLLMAASKKLLGISRGQQQGDAKDSLRYQKVYGPVEYFAQHVQRDGGSVARSLLWKATNKGNLDFIGSGSLQPHVSSVFNESNLTRFVDNSTPLDGVDNSMLLTRLGQGGLNSQDSAPIQMRLVQPSYYGYVGGIRTAEKSPGITAYLDKNVMKGTDGRLYQKFYNPRTGKEQLVDSQKAAASVVTTNQYMNSKDKYVYALGGDKGVRIVPRESVDYILPRADQAESMAGNAVPMMSGVKAMRLLMGCLHPQTPVPFIDEQGFTDLVPAKRLGNYGDSFLYGCDQKGYQKLYKLQGVYSRFPDFNRSFKRIITASGRVLVTSPDHKWYVYQGGKYKKITADKLQQGMLIPRSTFFKLPSRLTTIFGITITKEICVLVGRLLKSYEETPKTRRFTYVINQTVNQQSDIIQALKQLNIIGSNFYQRDGIHYVSISDVRLIDWIETEMKSRQAQRKIPKAILSLPKGMTSYVLDSYCKQRENVGEDIFGDIWLLDIPSPIMRDGLSLMLGKIYTDTYYRDSYKNGKQYRALKLIESENQGTVYLQPIKKILDQSAPAFMVDLDCGDNVYAVGNGIITHNSKYALQAVPLQNPQAPLVRSLDQASGKDMDTLIGKFVGAQFSPKSGIVQAVRKDRIDMLYDDGTKGSVWLYDNFPANAKGWLSNYPMVKAGQRVGQGQLLAKSNYTDDKGVAAMGRNLRIGYMSYHGGTFEDACTISQSAAKKMAYTTMYKTGMDTDKSIRSSKTLYNAWKPGEYTKEQMQKLDDKGVVKVGQTLNQGDPVILGIRTTQPSPGTMGKRLLTDVSQTWQHAHPGVVTDVVKTRDGIKVYAKVSAPLALGDKISQRYGGKGTIAQIIPDDKMPRDSKGRPLDILFDPLGIVSRCYDKQTKFLTHQGWKFGSDITQQEQLYIFDPKTNSCRWGKQLQPMYKKHYKGLMFGAKNVQCDFCVTYNHTMWAKSDYYKASFKELKIQDIYNKRYYVPAIRPSKNTQIQIVDYNFQLPILTAKTGRHKQFLAKPILYKGQLWAKLLGWYLTQGNTTYNERTCQYKVHISQSKKINPRQWWQIDTLLSQLRFTYHYSDKNIQFHIQGKRLASYFKAFGKCYQKAAPQWLMKAPLNIKKAFLDCALKGDGRQFTTKNGVHCATIALTSHRLIEQLHIICTELGYRAVIRSVKVKPGYQAMWRLSISYCNTDYMLRGTTWYTCQYDDMVYCPTVQTGYVVSCRNYKVLCAGNTNPSQMMQVGLGKVAQKLGHPIVVPQFMPKGQSRLKSVKDQMKKNNIPWKQDVYDPQTGKTISNVFTGNIYFLPLKHIADTKMSRRGTDQYSAQGIPGGSGQTGCFPAMQNIMTQDGLKSIEQICITKYSGDVLTYNKDTGSWCYSRVIDWFSYKAKKSAILQLLTDKGVIYPTKNHKMYKTDGTSCLAQQLKVGDMLRSFTGAVSVKQIKTNTNQTEVNVYDFTVKDTHNYCLTGGINVSNSKRLGAMELGGLVGHNAFNFIQDAKLIRGQSNAQFWRSLRTGEVPVLPGQPLVHKKFFAHLQGSGMHIRKTPKGISIMALTNKDVDQLAGNRELKSKDTYQQKTFREIDGGLFGKDIFGTEGNKWGYIQLDEPLPNPVMQEPLAKLLRMSDQQFQNVVSGKQEVNGLKNSSDIQKALSKIDLKAQRVNALKQLKEASASKRDAALKRYVAIARMQDNGTKPSDYMLDKIPVLPPEFRPITTQGNLTMVADSNYLYAQLLDARDDQREARNLTPELQNEARGNIYKRWKQLVGLYDPQSKKLKSKSVKGLLRWALGTSPKFSAFNRKVLGATVDTVGRAVGSPDPRLKLNQVGIPQQMAWGILAPFVTRSLVQQGYTPVDAMKLVKQKDKKARIVLLDQMSKRPVVVNRAPSLHKYNLYGAWPKLVTGHAMRWSPSICDNMSLDADGDQLNIHVPVSKKGIQDVINKMMPERMAILARKGKIAFMPQKAFMQGLYVATRMGDSSKGVKTFHSIQQAKQAYKNNQIDIDTPIIISK